MSTWKCKGVVENSGPWAARERVWERLAYSSPILALEADMVRAEESSSSDRALLRSMLNHVTIQDLLLESFSAVLVEGV